jgi:hypothetical protein
MVIKFRTTILFVFGCSIFNSISIPKAFGALKAMAYKCATQQKYNAYAAARLQKLIHILPTCLFKQIT